MIELVFPGRNAAPPNRGHPVIRMTWAAFWRSLVINLARGVAATAHHPSGVRTTHARACVVRKPGYEAMTSQCG